MMKSLSFKIAGAGLIPLALIGLGVPGLMQGLQSRSATELVEQFKSTPIFWQQFEVARKLVALHDTRLLQKLESSLSLDDRHLRGNAAFVFASLGDDRGFELIKAILTDRSDRPVGQGIPGGPWALAAQIAADRYYAVHLFGDLKDPKAVPILIPLLRDQEVNYIVPWALGEIADKSAIPPLTETLRDKNSDMRALAIYALKTLGAKEAVPELRLLLDDKEKIQFDGLISVADAAREAIISLDAKP